MTRILGITTFGVLFKAKIVTNAEIFMMGRYIKGVQHASQHSDFDSKIIVPMCQAAFSYKVMILHRATIFSNLVTTYFS
ncbi:hypothetical protein IFR05_014108, partial [Cadophora sp. M221]